jgi:NAD(P)-dependent dehydrogenase (short-subunit alcohol dehydrogenase family)
MSDIASQRGPHDGVRPRAWVISGASRGVGRALAEHVRRSGDLVVAGARDPLVLTPAPGLVPVRLDVTRPEQCAAAVRTCVQSFGRVDVVASVAGVGLVGAVEETPAELGREILEVNFWGALNLTRAALPALREQGSGHVIAVSSLSGRVSAPGNGFYAASKFAVEGLFEALHSELAPHNVRVTIVEPGGIRTDWAGTSLRHAPAMEAYAATAGRTRQILARANGNQGLSADEVAERIAGCVALPEQTLRIVIGADARSRITDTMRAELDQLAAGG